LFTFEGYSYNKVTIQSIRFRGYNIHRVLASSKEGPGKVIFTNLFHHLCMRVVVFLIRNGGSYSKDDLEKVALDVGSLSAKR